MRRCCVCKEEKELDEFRIKKYNKSGEPIYQAICIDCNKEYQREHYRRNKKLYKAKAREYDKKYKIAVYEFLLEFCRGGCEYCDEREFACLQFNHLEPEVKDFNIAMMISNKMPLQRIREEIEKCEVVCANCHMKITAEQFGWYKMLL